MSTVRVLAAVAIGGALGSAARYGVAVAWPTAAGEVDWATFGVNAAGCALIGVVMAVLDRRFDHPLARPFLGTGVLGGFTTFSGYAIGVVGLLGAGRPIAAFGYLAGTVVTALAATWLGMTAVRLVVKSAVQSAGQQA